MIYWSIFCQIARQEFLQVSGQLVRNANGPVNDDYIHIELSLILQTYPAKTDDK